MIEYCKRDVELLEKVYLKLEGFAKPKTHIGRFMDNDSCSCPKCGCEKTHLNKRTISPSGAVSVNMHCQGCKKYFVVSVNVYNNR